MNYLGIEIGGSKLQLLVGEVSGRVHERRRFAVDRGAGAAGIRAQITAALPALLHAYSLAALGVGFGGPANWQDGHVCVSHHISGWTGFPIAEWLREQSQCPVFVDNDANVAALGEALCGAGVGRNPCFYVTLGSGVGGGLIVDGAIYHGAMPGEAEIGHLRFDRSGATLESLCSGWAVDGRIREAALAEPGGLMARLTRGLNGGEARCLSAALAHGDAPARRLLAETAEHLAFGLSHVVHLFHPDVIVLGGGLSLVGEPWRAAVAAALPRWIMDAFRPGPAVVLAAMGEDAVPVGALRLAASMLARGT